MESALAYLWVLPLAWLLWKIKQYDDKDYLTRAEIEELIEKRTAFLDEEFNKVEAKIDTMAEQLVSISVTLARIDERMKRAD